MAIFNWIFYKSYIFIVFGFRTDESLIERKRKKIENTQPLEELYENNVAKIVEETGGKSIHMLLPIKTQNGFIKKRIIEEDNKVSNEEETEDASNKSQEENKEDNQQEGNSDTEMNMDTHVRQIIYANVS